MRIGCIVAVLVAASLGASVQGAGAQGPEAPYGWPRAHLSVAGDVTAVFGPRDRDAFFNYTDYDRDALRLARVRVVGEWRPLTHLSFVGEVRSGNSDWLEVAAWYVRWRPRDGGLQIQAGRIPPVIGAYPRRAYGRDLLLPTAPLAYQYLTSLRPDALPGGLSDVLAMRARGWRPSYPIGSTATGPGIPLVSGVRWDTGLEASWQRGWIDLAAAFTRGSPAVPVVHDTNGGRQISGRAAVTLPGGATVGVSGARGQWIEDGALDALPPASSRASTQSLGGVDGAYGRGRWLVRGEWLWSTFDVPLGDRANDAVSLGTNGGYVEGRYRFHPRWQVALRTGWLRFDHVVRPLDGRLVTWDAPVTRVEGVVAYRVTRRLDLRAGWQHHWRDGGRVRARGYPTASLLYWF